MVVGMSNRQHQQVQLSLNMPRLTLLYRRITCSVSRKAQPDFAMGLPSLVQKPRSLSRLSSLGRGAFMIVSHPVERRLNFFPHIFVCRVSLASAPVPTFSLVPRKRASSVRAWVMCVFSSLRVSRSWSFRKVLISCLICSASARFPHIPTIHSSAYLS